MHIYLVDPTDSTGLTLEVKENFPVEKVKYRYLILREKDKPMQSIRLTFRGEELEDGYILGDFDVKSSSAIKVEYITALRTEEAQTKDTKTKGTTTKDTKTKDTRTKARQTTPSTKERIIIQVDTSSESNLIISAFPDSTGLGISEQVYQKHGTIKAANSDVQGSKIVTRTYT